MAKKILVVEDEDVLANILASKLKSEGYDVMLAKDGEQGAEKIKIWRPDLVLLDIVMPKLSGFGVLEEIRQDQAMAKIPIIIISNSGQAVDIERAKAMGVKDWLIKANFDPEEVVDKVIKQIGKS